jgi:hypothetical protein
VNLDTCIAVAGIAANSTIAVKKYCVPKAQGKGVRGAPMEQWFVWYSEEWSFTAVEISFLDTVSGDALVVMRNNNGRTLSSGPLEQFVTVHPRSIQQATIDAFEGAQWGSAMIFDIMYGTSQDRVDRLKLVGMSSTDIDGIDAGAEQVLAITDMFVLPTQKESRRVPWVILSMVVASQPQSPPASDSPPPDQSTTASYGTYRRSVCIALDLDYFLASFGKLREGAHVCRMDTFFDTLRGSGYSTVVLRKSDSTGPLSSTDVMLVPSRKGSPLCVVHMGFLSMWSLSPEEDHGKHCFTTPDSFTAEGGIPLRDSWADFQRQMFVGSTGKETTMSSRGQVLAQNSDSEVVFRDEDAAAAGNSSLPASSDPSSSKVQVFATGDPDARTHWLQQVRIAAHWDGDGKPRSVSSRISMSVPSVTTVVTYHSCDRMSCLGCGSLRLQALCYAAQQCSVVQCIGTVVNQNRPMCNIGLVLKSYAESMLSTTLGAWLIFTETYSSVLDIALLGPGEGVSTEWVDDAFFGYICTAKDMLGQATGILTSSVGAAVMTSEKRIRSLVEEKNFIQGALQHDISDSAFTAWATMSLSGINSFLYQMTMLPLYMLVAMQKTVVCTTKDVFGVFDTTGFVVSIGRGDLQAASSVSSGMCMTQIFESQVRVCAFVCACGVCVLQGPSFAPVNVTFFCFQCLVQ